MSNNILLDLQMPIKTPRLEIRCLREGDGEELYNAKKETYEQLSRVFVWAAKPSTLEQDEAYVRRCQAQSILREDFHMVGFNKETNQPVVWAGVHCVDARTKEYQMGYWVRQSAQGKGYASEVANALTRYAFTVFQPNRLVGCHRDGNEASKKILQKIGFKFESVREKSLQVAGGNVVDASWYVRLDDKNLPKMHISFGD